MSDAFVDKENADATPLAPMAKAGSKIRRLGLGRPQKARVENVLGEITPSEANVNSVEHVEAASNFSAPFKLPRITEDEPVSAARMTATPTPAAAAPPVPASAAPARASRGGLLARMNQMNELAAASASHTLPSDPAPVLAGPGAGGNSARPVAEPQEVASLTSFEADKPPSRRSAPASRASTLSASASSVATTVPIAGGSFATSFSSSSSSSSSASSASSAAAVAAAAAARASADAGADNDSISSSAAELELLLDTPPPLATLALRAPASAPATATSTSTSMSAAAAAPVSAGTGAPLSRSTSRLASLVSASGPVSTPATAATSVPGPGPAPAVASAIAAALAPVSAPAPAPAPSARVPRASLRHLLEAPGTPATPAAAEPAGAIGAAALLVSGAPAAQAPASAPRPTAPSSVAAAAAVTATGGAVPGRSKSSTSVAPAQIPTASAGAGATAVMKSSSPSSSSSSASVSASGADLAGTSAAAAAAAAARRTLRPIVPHAVTIPTAVPASAALTVPHTAAAPAATAAAAASEDSGLFARHPHGEYLHVNGIRYLVVQEIGFGGSSRVYKVADAAGRQLALKKISLTPESRGHVANYEAEIRMLGKLRHQPHAIQLIDSQVPGTGTSVGTATCGGEDAIYMLFEFGTMDVAHLIKHPAQAAGAGGRRAAVGADGKVIGLSREQVRFFWREMALCVDMCHHNDIIHLDLKPSNFVLVDGRLKIIDFGIAKEIEEDATSVVRDSPVGTLNYMSPESILGMMSTTDARAAPLYKLNQSADVWSLGCMLYQMVYGKAPFAHVRSEFRLSAITNPAVKIEFPALPAHLTATLAGDDDALFNVLARCLNRDPKARITMTELLTHPFVLGRPGGPLAVTSQAVCEALARAELPGAPPAAARVLATLPLADRADFASWLRETLTDVIYGEK